MSKRASAEARPRSGSDVEVRPVERRTPLRRSLDNGTVRNGDFASAWASGRTMSAGRRPVAGPHWPIAAPQRHFAAPQRQVVAPWRHWPSQCRSIRAHARRSLPIIRGRAQGCRPDGLTGMGAVGRRSALMVRPPTRRTCRPDPRVPATTEPSCPGDRRATPPSWLAADNPRLRVMKDARQLVVEVADAATGDVIVAIRIGAAWTDTLASDPKLGDDRQTQHRYNAACAAALAAAGQSQDEAPLDDAAKAKLRGQALDWLKTELTVWDKLLESDRTFIVQTLSHWQKDTDLAGIRDARKNR